MFCTPTATFDPRAASTAVATLVYDGHTTISSRVCPAASGRKSRKKSRVSSGVLYIFQLAAITFFLMGWSFQFGMQRQYSNCAAFGLRARRRVESRGQKERIESR